MREKDCGPAFKDLFKPGAFDFSCSEISSLASYQSAAARKLASHAAEVYFSDGDGDPMTVLDVVALEKGLYEALRPQIGAFDSAAAPIQVSADAPRALVDAPFGRLKGFGGTRDLGLFAYYPILIPPGQGQAAIYERVPASISQIGFGKGFGHGEVAAGLALPRGHRVPSGTAEMADLLSDPRLFPRSVDADAANIVRSRILVAASADGTPYPIAEMPRIFKAECPAKGEEWYAKPFADIPLDDDMATFALEAIGAEPYDGLQGMPEGLAGCVDKALSYEVYGREGKKYLRISFRKHELRQAIARLKRAIAMSRGGLVSLPDHNVIEFQMARSFLKSFEDLLDGKPLSLLAGDERGWSERNPYLLIAIIFAIVVPAAAATPLGAWLKVVGDEWVERIREGRSSGKNILDKYGRDLRRSGSRWRRTGWISGRWR